MSHALQQPAAPPAAPDEAAQPHPTARLFLRALPVLVAHPDALRVAGEFDHFQGDEPEALADVEAEHPDVAAAMRAALAADFPSVARAHLTALCRDAHAIVEAARPAPADALTLTPAEAMPVRFRVVSLFLQHWEGLPARPCAALRRMCDALARWPLAADDASEGAVLARRAVAQLLPHLRRPPSRTPTERANNTVEMLQDYWRLRQMVWPNEEYEEEDEEAHSSWDDEGSWEGDEDDAFEEAEEEEEEEGAS